jgi:drug/metabolite transporter (DMT)-like permease
VTDRSIAGVVAGGLFVTTVAIGLAGADKPPPLGFLWLVAALAATCLFGFYRLNRHLSVRGEAAGLTRRVAVEGAGVGLAMVLVFSLVGGAEQGVTVDMASRLIGVAVLVCVGSVVALMGWFVAVQFQSRVGRLRHEPPV